MVSRNAREIFTISFPLQFSTRRRLLRYNSNRNCLKILFICIFQEMYPHLSGQQQLPYAPGTRRWRSLFHQGLHISSVLYQGRSEVPSASSPIATETPPAPKSLHFLISMADFLSAEHTLDLTLCRCITFLHLCAADLDRSLCVYLGGTGCTADTVTAGTSAKQDDDISRIGMSHGLPHVSELRP